MPVAVVTTIVVLLVLSLRLFTRTHVIRRGLGWDDCECAGNGPSEHFADVFKILSRSQWPAPSRSCVSLYTVCSP